MYGYGYRYNSGLVVGAGGGGGGFLNTYSLDFDGVDDYVGLGNPTDLQITGAFSFSCWVNTTSTNYEGIYFKGNSISLSDIYIRMQNNGTVRMFINKLAKNVTSSTAINDGNWHHIICVYVPSTSMTIYIDGSQDAQNTTTIPASINNNYGNITIGGGGGQYFEGNIDEASIFNTDQSANIATLSASPAEDLTSLSPTVWIRMGDNGAYKSPQWLLPSNENKDKVSNYSFDFDGVDDYVNFGNPTELQITGALTLSVWTKLDSSVGVQSCIISKDNGTSQRAFSFWGKIVNKPVFYIWNGATSYNVGGTTNIADDTWHHVAVVYVPSTSIRIYVDGVLEGTNTTSIPASINNANYDFKIGHFAGSLFEYKGLMDEVSVFDSDQSANIATLYNSGTPTTLPSGAVAHYKMGEDATFSGGVWTVPDAVGSNDGTSNAMTIEDRVGDAPNSSNNALSYNMDEVDRVTDTP